MEVSGFSGKAFVSLNSQAPVNALSDLASAAIQKSRIAFISDESNIRLATKAQRNNCVDLQEGGELKEGNCIFGIGYARVKVFSRILEKLEGLRRDSLPPQQEGHDACEQPAQYHHTVPDQPRGENQMRCCTKWGQ